MPKLDKAIRRSRQARREKLYAPRHVSLSGQALKASRQQRRALLERYGA